MAEFGGDDSKPTESRFCDLRTKVEDSILLAFFATLRGVVQSHTSDANRAMCVRHDCNHDCPNDTLPPADLSFPYFP